MDESLTLDPDAVSANVTEHTRAIMPVHMRGAPARLDALRQIADEHGIALIEDCAQACGATFHGRPVGGFGDVGCFSLQIHKVITTGEGGMIVTGDPELLFRAKCFHHSASEWRGAAWQDPDPAVRATFQGFPGMNFRMGELAGAVGGVQLGRLDDLLTRMRARKQAFDEALDTFPGVRLREANDFAGDAGVASIFYVASPELAGRVAGALRAEGVGARVLYIEGEHDWHVYSCWRDILAKRSWSDHGYPWSQARREIVYSDDMCPHTSALLARAVHIDVSPQLEQVDVEETMKALEKVIDALC